MNSKFILNVCSSGWCNVLEMSVYICIVINNCYRMLNISNCFYFR